jgi:hypothetical protein
MIISKNIFLIIIWFLINFQKCQRYHPDDFETKRFKDTIIPIPPLLEQKAIADYLDKACEKIDRVIAIKQEQLEKLRIILIQN